MVLINGKEFKIYELDSVETIINRIASQYDTIPKYIYFPLGKPNINLFLSTSNVEIENLFRSILSFTKDFNFDKLYVNIKDKMSQNKLDLYEDILIPFIIYSEKLKNIPDMYRNYLLTSLAEYMTPINSSIDIDKLQRIWKEKDENEQIFNKSISNNKSLVLQNNKKNLLLETITEGVENTKFELEKISYKLTLNIKNIVTINEIFNYVILDKYVPFVNLNNTYYKILKEFNPYIEWSNSKYTGITFKVLEKNTNNPIQDDYTNVILSIENDIIIATIKCSTTLNYNPINTTIQNFLNTIRNLNPLIIKQEEIQVNGVFYFPKQEMDVYVLSDLILNNDLFSSLLVINESKKVGKDKDSTYIYFNLEKIGKITANLTEKIMNKNDSTMKNKDREFFPYNIKYLRVKITRAMNTQAVNDFKNILSKLLVIYNSEYPKIVSYYRKYIPTFGIKKIIEPIISRVNLKDIVPELFLPLYSRKCTNKPTIISDEEKLEAETEGKKIMIFPKQGGEIISRNYICNHPKHIYPGLRKNPFENKDKYPYLPCCYIKNQEDIQGSIYREYYYGENIPEKEMKQQDLITTEKILNHDQFGTLPSNIQKLFDISENDKKYYYVRKGVFRTTSSFLECIIEAVDINKIIKLTNLDSRQKFLNNIRLSLAIPELASCCRQELYDLSEIEIINLIKDPNVYFDPKLFIHLLETVYNCNIFLFTRTNLGGELSLPRHLQTYLKNKSNKTCIFIFEHIGSESDNSQYPQCELIIKYNNENKNEEPTYNFKYNSIVSENTNYVFNQIKKSYILNKQIIDANFNFRIIPQYQVIDKYGKTRLFNFIFKKKNINMFTSPIQPLPIIENTSTTISKIDLETALEFAYIMNINIQYQNVFNNIVKNIIGYIGNVQIIIPVLDSKPVDNIQIISKPILYPEKYISNIKLYNTNKKNARYIIEYMLWLYSTYIHNNKFDIEDINNIKSFIKNKTYIIPKHTYDNIGNIFSLSSSLIYDGKLIITSEEMLKRLVYVLRLEIIRDKDKLINYYTKTTMSNYYVDITDFDIYPHQIILVGKSSIEKILKDNIRYTLDNTIKINYNNAYFFKNNLIDNNIYIAQNSDNINDALKIERIWTNKKYNIGTEVDNETEKEIFSFILYSYSNSQNITKKYINYSEDKDNYKILGYKKDNKSQFISLLSLN